MADCVPECICTFAQKAVGDGCGYCNPDKALDYAHDTINDLEAERDALKALNGELITVLKDIQSMDDSSLWEQNDTVSYIAKFARQAINKAREVMK